MTSDDQQGEVDPAEMVQVTPEVVDLLRNLFSHGTVRDTTPRIASRIGRDEESTESCLSYLESERFLRRRRTNAGDVWFKPKEAKP